MLYVAYEVPPHHDVIPECHGQVKSTLVAVRIASAIGCPFIQSVEDAG